jgi:hypothetical protein
LLCRDRPDFSERPLQIRFSDHTTSGNLHPGVARRTPRRERSRAFPLGPASGDPRLRSAPICRSPLRNRVGERRSHAASSLLPESRRCIAQGR